MKLKAPQKRLFGLFVSDDGKRYHMYTQLIDRDRLIAYASKFRYKYIL